MDKIVQKYFNIYFTEIIVGALIISIIVVLVSIFFVLFSSTDVGGVKKPIIKKTKKIKYTKQFLRGVADIDLDLKVNKKNS